jgi:hypothetical protein
MNAIDELGERDFAEEHAVRRIDFEFVHIRRLEIGISLDFPRRPAACSAGDVRLEFFFLFDLSVGYKDLLFCGARPSLLLSPESMPPFMNK